MTNKQKQLREFIAQEQNNENSCSQDIEFGSITPLVTSTDEIVNTHVSSRDDGSFFTLWKVLKTSTLELIGQYYNSTQQPVGEQISIVTHRFIGSIGAKTFSKNNDVLVTWSTLATSSSNWKIHLRYYKYHESNNSFEIKYTETPLEAVKDERGRDSKGKFGFESYQDYVLITTFPNSTHIDTIRYRPTEDDLENISPNITESFCSRGQNKIISKISPNGILAVVWSAKKTIFAKHYDIENNGNEFGTQIEISSIPKSLFIDITNTTTIIGWQSSKISQCSNLLQNNLLYYAQVFANNGTSLGEVVQISENPLVNLNQLKLVADQAFSANFLVDNYVVNRLYLNNGTFVTSNLLEINSCDIEGQSSSRTFKAQNTIRSYALMSPFALSLIIKSALESCTSPSGTDLIVGTSALFIIGGGAYAAYAVDNSKLINTIEGNTNACLKTCDQRYDQIISATSSGIIENTEDNDLMMAIRNYFFDCKNNLVLQYNVPITFRLNLNLNSNHNLIVASNSITFDRSISINNKGIGAVVFKSLTESNNGNIIITSDSLIEWDSYNTLKFDATNLINIQQNAIIYSHYTGAIILDSPSIDVDPTAILALKSATVLNSKQQQKSCAPHLVFREQVTLYYNLYHYTGWGTVYSKNIALYLDNIDSPINFTGMIYLERYLIKKLSEVISKVNHIFIDVANKIKNSIDTICQNTPKAINEYILLIEAEIIRALEGFLNEFGNTEIISTLPTPLKPIVQKKINILIANLKEAVKGLNLNLRKALTEYFEHCITNIRQVNLEKVLNAHLNSILPFLDLDPLFYIKNYNEGHTTNTPLINYVLSAINVEPLITGGYFQAQRISSSPYSDYTYYKRQGAVVGADERTTQYSYGINEYFVQEFNSRCTITRFTGDNINRAIQTSLVTGFTNRNSIAIDSNLNTAYVVSLKNRNSLQIKKINLQTEPLEVFKNNQPNIDVCAGVIPPILKVKTTMSREGALLAYASIQNQDITLYRYDKNLHQQSNYTINNINYQNVCLDTRESKYVIAWQDYNFTYSSNATYKVFSINNHNEEDTSGSNVIITPPSSAQSTNNTLYLLKDIKILDQDYLILAYLKQEQVAEVKYSKIAVKIVNYNENQATGTFNAEVPYTYRGHINDISIDTVTNYYRVNQENKCEDNRSEPREECDPSCKRAYFFVTWSTPELVQSFEFKFLRSETLGDTSSVNEWLE